MQNIHFKVAANNSFRRFSLAEVTFASLKTQVASLFGILDLNGWFIKYKDEENQLVTITSDEELFYAIQLHGGKVLRLEISFSSDNAEKHGNWSHRHEGKRGGHRARLAVRLNHKQERLRERLASLNPEENPHCKAQASKIEATIASISMELESLKLNNEKDKEMPDSRNSSVQNTSVELVTAENNAAKHTDRKDIKCNKFSCLIRKQEHVREKLARLGEETDNPRKQAKIAKLKEKLAAITSNLEGMAKDSSPVPMDLKVAEKPADSSSGIPKAEDANKQLVQDVKSKFFLMKRELHQDKMQVISLVKTLKALRVISRHGVSAGISLDVNQLAQTEVSLGIARDQLAAKKLVIQQQRELLGLMRSQLGYHHGKNFKKCWKGKRDKECNKEKDDKVENGRVEKSEKWKREKKFRDEKRPKHRRHCRGRRDFRKAEDDMEVSTGNSSSENSEKLEI